MTREVGLVCTWIAQGLVSVPATQQPCSGSQGQGQEEELLLLPAIPVHEEQGPERQ